MNTEVELDTRIDVEFDDGTVWEAVEDSVNDAAREAVENYAWDTVCSDVENLIDQMVSDRTDDRADVDDHLNDLLQQLKGRTERGEALCGLGTSARDAIIAVFDKAMTGTRATPAHTPDEAQATEALEVQRRLADLERQMRVILAEITNLGERAASLTPNSVV